MTTPRWPGTANDPPRGSGLAWGGPAPRPARSMRGNRVTLRPWVDADLAPFAAINEAALALHYGFEVAGLPQIISFAAQENRASIAVMRRIGVTPRGAFDHPQLPPEHRSHRHVLYAKDAT